MHADFKEFNKWNANRRVNEKLSDRENQFLPCRASFIIKMRIIIPLYIPFSAGLCNLQLTQSNRKIKDIFWIKTKALGRLPALTVYYTLCSSEEAKSIRPGSWGWHFQYIPLEKAQAAGINPSQCMPLLPWTPSRQPLGEPRDPLCAARHCRALPGPLQQLCFLRFLAYPTF